ncbi:hypothetical protein VTJ49DRAFT_4165 [Mycothermus thermophilus]|uniref:Uncharacterized protein n=1 Tax=Humicola insolens TaxID=85995 RepID=A0ABR3V616_HUMIN
MPALPVPLEAITNSEANQSNTPDTPVQVVCAFPVSGQYGFGSRVLYYAFVMICIVARKKEWLRNACLAAALVTPAVAAIHAWAIVIVKTRFWDTMLDDQWKLVVTDIVDLDTYGVLQFCAIGALVAPITARRSKTYLRIKGINVMSAWAILLAGSLAMIVSVLYRVEPTACSDDGSGQPILRGSKFPYGNTTCGLTCSVEEGTFTSLRRGPADSVHVVPAPTVFPFRAAAGFAAACFISTSLVPIWSVLESSWKKSVVVRFMATESTASQRGKVLKAVGKFLRRVEVFMFGGAVIALVIIGEWNFWSEPMMWDTEPLSNVSQWSGLVSALLVVMGSLPMIWDEDRGGWYFST